MRSAAAAVLLALAPGCRRGADDAIEADVGSEVAPEADTSIDGGVADTGTISPETLVDAMLPDAWSGGPFATGVWTTHTLDGGACFMKLAHGAARAERALRFESCGTGCKRSIADWASAGYRLTTAPRSVEEGVLFWSQVYPRADLPSSPEYGVSIAQPLDGGPVQAAVGSYLRGGRSCTLHYHPRRPTGVYVLEITKSTLPIALVEGDSLTLLRDVPLATLLDGGVTGVGWSTWTAPGFVHVQTFGPAALAVVAVPEGPIPTSALHTPPAEFPVAVAGGSIMGDYYTGVGAGLLWFVGNDGKAIKLYEVPSTRELRWFDADRKRSDTLVWAEYDPSATTYSLWESPLSTSAGGAKPKKLHTQDSGYGSFIANAGAVAFFGGTAGQVKVLRVSDGVVETLTAPAADRPLEMVWMDEKEVWFTSEPASTSPPGTARSFIVRLAR